MITTHKHNPIVGLVHSLDISSNHLLIVLFLFEAKATIPGYNYQSICKLILDAEFEHQLIKVSMNVTGDNNCLGFGKR